MKFFVALSFLAGMATANPFAAQSANSAKASYTAALMKNARRLNDNANADVQVDVTSYAVKFEQCQFIKAYDDDLADDQDSDTVLGVKRFVIFRLCPDNTCSTCSSNYGEYMVDLDTYLQATVTWAKQNEEDMCTACDACAAAADAAAADAAAADAAAADAAAADAAAADAANGDAAAADGGRRELTSVDCSTCADECTKIANMEANGYIDATTFLECQLIYDPADDTKTALYAGPVCASSGTKINIGVFTDKYCYVADESKSIDDYLLDGNGNKAKLSFGLLKTVYSGTCISCANEAADDGVEQATEMCQTLYDDAAKCEASHGMTSAFYDTAGFENQVAQETVVCDFIKSVSNGAYDSTGEISIYGGNTKGSRSSSTNTGQSLALSFFILGTVGLAAYAALLHTKLTKGGKAGLANQGGAMA